MGKAKRVEAGEEANEDTSAASGGADEKRKVMVPAFAASPKKERVAPAVDGDLAYSKRVDAAGRDLRRCGGGEPA